MHQYDGNRGRGVLGRHWNGYAPGSYERGRELGCSRSVPESWDHPCAGCASKREKDVQTQPSAAREEERVSTGKVATCATRDKMKRTSSHASGY